MFEKVPTGCDAIFMKVNTKAQLVVTYIWNFNLEKYSQILINTITYILYLGECITKNFSPIKGY